MYKICCNKITKTKTIDTYKKKLTKKHATKLLKLTKIKIKMKTKNYSKY